MALLIDKIHNINSYTLDILSYLNGDSSRQINECINKFNLSDTVRFDRAKTFSIVNHVLASLISIYSFTNNERVKLQLTELGNRLLASFDYDDGSGNLNVNKVCPSMYMTLGPNPKYINDGVNSGIPVAEAGSVFVEMHALSDSLSDDSYNKASKFCEDTIEKVLEKETTYSVTHGVLVPEMPRVMFHRASERFSGFKTLGAGADSFVEYLLKIFIYTSDKKYLTKWANIHYDAAMHMTWTGKFTSNMKDAPSTFTLMGEVYDYGSLNLYMNHYLYMQPVNMIMGVHILRQMNMITAEQRNKIEQNAKDLMMTCYYVFGSPSDNPDLGFADAIRGDRAQGTISTE